MRAKTIAALVVVGLAFSAAAFAAPPCDVPGCVTPTLPTVVELPEPFAAPEISALGGGAAIGLLVAAVLLIRERTGRR
jgi:hypothetical protein